MDDLGPLTGLTLMDSLHFNDNQVDNLSPLVPMQNLRFLDAARNQITHVLPLWTMDALVEVDLTGNPIDCKDQAAALEAAGGLFTTVEVDCP